MVRVRAPTSVIRPSASWRITTRLASHARRCDVSAGTYAPFSTTDCPGASASASTAASTWTTTWSFARSTRIDSVVQGRLGDQGECVCLLLLNRRPVRRTVEISLFRGTVDELRSRGTVGGLFRTLTQRLSRRRDRLNHHGARLGLQPRA